MTIEEANQGGGIASAHAAFERLTGKQYMLHTARIFAWEKFLVRRKLTVEDIGIVVKHLHGEVAAKKAFPPQLWFSNLIEQPDRFEEYLNDAKAKTRNAAPPKTDRDSVLEATGRCKPCEQRQGGLVGMSERVQYHLDQMRKAAK